MLMVITISLNVTNSKTACNLLYSGTANCSAQASGLAEQELLLTAKNMEWRKIAPEADSILADIGGRVNLAAYLNTKIDNICQFTMNRYNSIYKVLSSLSLRMLTIMLMVITISLNVTNSKTALYP